MSYRNAQIFIQGRTLKLLRLVAKLYPVKDDAALAGDATADQVADSIIQTAIAMHYPLAMGLMREQDRLEKEWMEKRKQNDSA